ncbi:glycosyltransferase family 2 protein [Opacimonas viscosa]|uniref:Glycosyltransferase family 2 protein n=1 Tax=Opacimonas viscosa TaxID=2961944 RepID=A0AA41WZE6_9ALTE|nr:glycosyltransferase family 2 protein [Opacimonas viscosa]MCP3429125.1 glycosyltransferase family 2 protein [Opacimonas viscosa]
MNVYISVVSHGHSSLINQLSCLPELAKRYKVIVKSNKLGDSFCGLNNNSNFHWIDKSYGLGFGHNNNIVFNFCRSTLGMNQSDYFIVLNPDVFIESNEIDLLIKKMIESNSKLAAINLYKDYDGIIHDYSIRKFPSLMQFAKSFLGLGNSSLIDKSVISAPCKVDWAAGSFLGFVVSHYAALNGFDENYFMYCEDIDICYRSHLLGEKVTYFPQIRAVHLTKHANRKLFSKHFYWHVISAIRFLLSKFGLTQLNSSCN